MKKIIYAMFLLAALCGCTQENILKPYGPDDGKAPGTVSMVSYTQIPGGANITFLSPTDQDLMYVKAEYTLSTGEKREARSSAYSNQLKIEGFGDTNEKVVTLSAVDRMNNEGAKSQVTITPGKPSYLDAFESLTLGSTFGGVYVSMVNADNGNLIVELLKKDEMGIWQNIYTEYTSRKDIRFSVRGMETVTRDFGVFVQDPWNNTTDTVFASLTPIFEQELDPSKFAERFEKNDIRVDEWGFRMSNIWNGQYGWGVYNMLHSPESGNAWPAHFTFDLGVKAELSRLRYWQRMDDNGRWMYAHGNPRKFEIWGRLDAPDPNDEWGGWTLLLECESIKPSGLPNGLGLWTAEDREYAEKGEEFEFAPGLPIVRYIRMNVLTNWSDTQFICFSQLKFWGQEVN